MGTTYKETILQLIAEASGVGKVIGARILVKDVEPLDELSAAARRSGLHIVVYDQNKPRPTEGIVIGVGGDPLVQEEIQVGDHVFFPRFAGHNVYEEGREYRSVEFQEVTRVKSREFYGWKDEEPVRDKFPQTSLGLCHICGRELGVTHIACGTVRPLSKDTV